MDDPIKDNNDLIEEKLRMLFHTVDTMNKIFKSKFDTFERRTNAHIDAIDKRLDAIEVEALRTRTFG